MLYNTIENALQTNLTANIIKVEGYEHKGQKRQSIKAMKSRGKRVYTIIRYENGQYSEAV